MEIGDTIIITEVGEMDAYYSIKEKIEGKEFKLTTSTQDEGDGFISFNVDVLSKESLKVLGVTNICLYNVKAELVK